MSATTDMTPKGFESTSRDEPVFFPEGSDTYCGFLTTPASSTMNTTGVVLLAGTGPGSGTIGRNRMWVRMARKLADSGTPVLRFDYAGVGDSSGEMLGYDLDTPAIPALKAAFDLLGSRGVEDILVVGTCYGARTALAGSVGDPRVTALHLLVPPVKSARKGTAGAEQFARYAAPGAVARKAVAPRTIKRLLTSRAARTAAIRFVTVKARGIKGALNGSEPGRPDRAIEASPRFEEPFHDLLRDGVAIHCLFGVDDFYWTEFVEATEGRLGVHINEFTNLVEVETIPGVLRGFPSIRVQNLAIESVVAWVQEHTSGREFKRVTGGGQHTGVRDHGHGTEEVVFFGTEPRMYGVTHLPAGDSRACVVICSSTHAELQKTYRHETVLARALATRGFAVQRFHYKGTGNSEGDISELTFPAMIDAGRQATERIVDLAKAQDVVFVGVRLGAYPAISLAAEFSSTSIVFWDPVLDADRFMKEALRSHAIAAIRAETKPETVQQTLQRLERDGWIDLLGFEMTSQFHASIKGKKLIDYSLDESEVLIVPFGKLNTEPLVQAWSRSAVRVTNAPGAQRTAWWLAEAASEERMKDGEALAHRTADWISAAIPH